MPTWAAIKETSNYPCFFICKAAIPSATFHRRDGKVVSTTTFLFGYRIYIKFYQFWNYFWAFPLRKSYLCYFHTHHAPVISQFTDYLPMFPRHTLQKYFQNKCSRHSSLFLGQYPGETQLNQHKPTKKAWATTTEIVPFTLHPNFIRFTHTCGSCLTGTRFPQGKTRCSVPRASKQVRFVAAREGTSTSGILKEEHIA